MSEFKVEVIEITSVSKHPNADALEIVNFGGFEVVSKMGQWKVGDKAVYIPQQSIVPESMMNEMGLKTNRIKPIRLRGILSEGILYPAKEEWQVDQDVAEELGIVKWEPKSNDPKHKKLFGKDDQVYYAGHRNCINYDFENIKHPKVRKTFEGLEEVVMLEKLHGTFTQIGYSFHPHDECGHWLISSKGRAKNGLCLKPDSDNVYTKVFKKHAAQFEALAMFLKAYVEKVGAKLHNVFILGETYGGGVQDLHYGSPDEVSFAVFDMIAFTTSHAGVREEIWFGWDVVKMFCEDVKLPTVKELYRGPLTDEALQEYTCGMEVESGSSLHVREGVVVKQVGACNRLIEERIIAKSINPDYLTRKNATDFN